MSVLLEVENVSVNYGNVRAVQGVSLDVKEGEVLGLIGRNGAGKSSLLASIAGLLPRSGQVLLRDIELHADSPVLAVRMGVAIALERRELFSSMSVEDNLFLGAYGQGARRMVTVKQSDRLSLVHERLPRLKERCKQLAGTLSGGEQQMLALGRALMTGAELLLLDEPSLGLAPIVVEGIYDTISDLNADGISFIVVEESPQRIFHAADRLVVMERGSAVLSGPVEEFQRDPSLLKRLYLGH